MEKSLRLCWAKTISKKHRMNAVKATPFAPAELVARFQAAGQRHGFRSEPIGEQSGCPLIALTRRTPGPKPRVYLSSGVHGDEPAPPLGLLSLLERGVFDDRAVWFLVPMLNPAGYLRGTRENGEGVDLNRDYRHLQSPEVRAHLRWLRRQPPFTATFCLHEDWESVGFYLYELNPAARRSLAELMIEAVRAHHPIDLSELIDGRPARGGILRPDPQPDHRELWPEAIYLRAHHTTLSYTLETPSALPLPQRIAMQNLAVETALESLLGPRQAPA